MLELLGGRGLIALEREHGSGKGRERAQGAVVLELLTRERRRKVHRFRRLRRRGAGHECVERQADAFEIAPAGVDTVDPGRDEEAGFEKVLQERHLLWDSGTEIGHQTSFAIRSRPALLLWI